MLVGEPATCTSKHLSFIRILVHSFTTFLLPIFGLSICTLLQDFAALQCQCFVLVVLLVFGATLGGVPVTIRSYIVDTSWFNNHFRGYIIYKGLS